VCRRGVSAGSMSDGRFLQVEHIESDVVGGIGFFSVGVNDFPVFLFLNSFEKAIILPVTDKTKRAYKFFLYS
jgi:hypothetical protein